MPLYQVDSSQKTTHFRRVESGDPTLCNATDEENTSEKWYKSKNEYRIFLNDEVKMKKKRRKKYAKNSVSTENDKEKKETRNISHQCVRYQK